MVNDRNRILKLELIKDMYHMMRIDHVETGLQFLLNKPISNSVILNRFLLHNTFSMSNEIESASVIFS